MSVIYKSAVSKFKKTLFLYPAWYKYLRSMVEVEDVIIVIAAVVVTVPVAVTGGNSSGSATDSGSGSYWW